MNFSFLLFLFLFICLLSFCSADATTSSPTTVATTKALTTRPTRAPTKKPVAPIPNIYGENEMIKLPSDVQQGIVGALTILLFILMATEITGPEVLFLIALMVVTLAQILTLSEALSGM